MCTVRAVLLLGLLLLWNEDMLLSHRYGSSSLQGLGIKGSHNG